MAVSICSIKASCLRGVAPAAAMTAAQWRTVSSEPLKLIRSSGTGCRWAERCIRVRTRLESGAQPCAAHERSDAIF